MPIDTTVFERIGRRVSPDELENLIVEALDRIVPARVVADPSRDLTPEEVAALARGGVDPAWRGSDATDPVVRTAAEYAALLASSLTVEQVAGLLGVDSSRVRHRLADRTLCGIKERSGWRLPAFQFASARLVPGIDRVLPLLPTDLHPLAVVGWFTRPNPDLLDDNEETPMRPLDWLSTGRDPDRVARLAPSVGMSG
jgi:hypothetical protein